MMDKKVIMPAELTAENGAKYALSGEFFVDYEIGNPEYCGCGECRHCRRDMGNIEYIEQRVAVDWTTIKEIYALAVKNLGEEI